MTSVNFPLILVFFFLNFFNKGARPVFPDKSDKDKPKFAVKGHKDTTEYPFKKHNVVLPVKGEGGWESGRIGCRSEEEEKAGSRIKDSQGVWKQIQNV